MFTRKSQWWLKKPFKNKVNLLVVTKLSKFTRAEFSPKKDWGVFFVAPVDGLSPVDGKLSPNKLNSNGSELLLLLLLLVPFVFGDVLFLFVIASNSSKSVDEPWLAGDQGSWFFVGGEAAAMGFHGSTGLGVTAAIAAAVGCHGSTWWVGEVNEFDCCQVVDCKRGKC